MRHHSKLLTFQYPAKLGVGERAASALTQSRRARLLSNDNEAIRFCERKGMQVISLVGILRLFWTEQIMSQAGAQINEMAATSDVYQSARLARGYAYDRPPVHREIIAKLRDHLQLTERLPRALDIGCGAGLSTAALEAVAVSVFGIEPVAPMLQYRAVVTTKAHFAVARAEQLPFAAQSFDLLTAAGSLNYADLALFLPEAARVLKAQGMLAIYDFSEGRRLYADPRLEQWYAAFKQRYPSPPGYALDVRALPYESYGLRLRGYHELEVALPLTHANYLRYALSETSVELAIRRGVAEADIEAWCRDTLADIFDAQPREVFFDAYIAYVGREGQL